MLRAKARISYAQRQSTIKLIVICTFLPSTVQTTTTFIASKFRDRSETASFEIKCCCVNACKDSKNILKRIECVVLLFIFIERIVLTRNIT